MSIERRPDSGSGGLSEADAAWPRRLRRIVRAGLTNWGHPDLAETAELLLTELTTNALRHAGGPDIGIRVHLQGYHLVIKVNDGSPLRPALRCAGPDDENGRGLLLVESLSEAWGVSEDGTTTWCTLPLTEGLSDTHPAAATAPVLRDIPLDLPADPSAAGLARIQARILLTVLSWPGNQHLAIDVLRVLIDNAVQHALPPGTAGQHLGACLSVTEADELLIDVTDPNPTFPDFDKAIAGEPGRRLWEIARQGVKLTWFAGPEFDGKTVRAALRPGQVDL
ncbi:ATP-binding protein [Streptomyces sp. NPDC005526]|uniref:ATP-binding protein n=1 Tax=Streptomyces sp. NPDC005526 TaxID=3156885 RepID=UPI0033B647C0